MNKAHRIVWSESRGAFIVAHEYAATSGKRSSTRTVIARSIAIAALVAASAPAFAQTTILGTGQSVTNSGTIQGTGGSPGVAVYGAKAGSITNTGTIASSPAGGETTLLYGVFVGSGGGLSGGITNSGTVSVITGTDIGVNIVSTSTVANIINGGMINGTSVSGITLQGGQLGTISNTSVSSLISGGTVGIAVMSGATAAGVVNAGTISGGQTGIYVTGSGTLLSGVTNSGTSSLISGNTFGISVEGGANLGPVANQGTIVGGQAGIYVDTGSSISSISNLGSLSVIQGTGGGTAFPHGVGISVVDNGKVGSINNQGTIAGLSSGIYLNGTGATIGSITNSGTVIGTGNQAIAVENGSTVTGSITNSGHLIGGYTGVYVEGNSSVGSVVNSGTVSSTSTNNGAGVAISSGATVGSIQNLAGGVINAGRTGIRINSGASVGSVVNNGLINGSGDIGVQIYSAGRITGGLTNTGTITGGSRGGIALFSASTLAGGITNSGTIERTGGIDGFGILVGSGSTISGGIHNLAGGVISGASGIVIYSGAKVDSISNAAGGTITGSNLGINISGGTLTGGLNNAGLIMGNSSTGVLIRNATVGAIVNSGTIAGTSYGINVDGATSLTGGLTNSGLIRGGAGTSGAGVAITSVSFTGSLVNTGTIVGGGQGVNLDGFGTATRIANIGSGATISGGFDGLVVDNGVLTAGITNSGHIIGGSYGLTVENVSLTGGVNNSGTISGASSFGLALFATTVSGGINNLPGGVITSASTGALVYFSAADSITNSAGATISGTGAYNPTNPYAAGLFIFGSSISGRITNNGAIFGGTGGLAIGDSTVGNGLLNTGTISGGQYGLSIAGGSGSSFTGGISNSGVISGAHLGGVLLSGVTIAGGITNSQGGVITGNQGVLLEGSTLDSLSNAGVISGGAVGVGVKSTSNVTGGISNQAGGLITGGVTGIAVRSTSTVTGSIANAGTISGGKYSVYVEGTSTLDGIAISGKTAAFVGDVYAPHTAVSETSGAVFTGTNAFNVASFDVASGATLNLNTMASTSGGAAGITVANGLTNEGTVSVGHNVGTINGSYTQAANGTFSLGASSAKNYGHLAVNGAANLSPNANIYVNIAANNTLTNKETLTGVLTSTDLTASTFKVTDNNDLIGFKGLIDGNNVDLVTSFNAIVLPDVLASKNINAVGAATALDQIILTSNGTGPFTGVINDIASLQSSRLVSNAASQTVPVLSGDVNVATYAALSQMNQVVQSRVNGNYGMSAGSPYLQDQNAWIKPFGSWANLGDQNGAPGFTSSTSGVALGGDGAISNAARVGLAFAYANVDVSGNSHDAPNNDRINMYQLMGYGSYAIDPRTEVNAQLDGGINSNDGNRSIAFAHESATSSFNSSDAHFGIGIARSLPLSDSVMFTPQVRVDYTWISTDDYTEGGAGPLSLHTQSTSFESLLTQINGKLTQKINDNLSWFGNLGVGYDSMAHTNTSVVAAFTGAPGLSFSTQGAGLSPRALLGGIGIASTAHGNTPELSFRYDVQQREGFSDQSISFKARWSF